MVAPTVKDSDAGNERDAGVSTNSCECRLHRDISLHHDASPSFISFLPPTITPNPTSFPTPYHTSNNLPTCSLSHQNVG